MKLILVAFAILALSGCASVKPYLVCRVADSKAEVMQGMAGIGVGQELKDADALCAKPAVTLGDGLKVK